MNNIANYQPIVRRIQSMSAHDIIMAMVNGFLNPFVECAATNTILHIINANEDEVKAYVTPRSLYDDDYPLTSLECAIDWLKEGDVHAYNEYVYPFGITLITPIPGQKLPVLDSFCTEDELQEYERLAEYQS